jgi:hypothetical protein
MVAPYPIEAIEPTNLSVAWQANPMASHWSAHCGDLAQCPDGTCHLPSSIDRGVCTLGCQAGQRRCADRSCLAASATGAECPSPLIMQSVKPLDVEVDLSVLSPSEVEVYSTEGHVLATLRLAHLALGSSVPLVRIVASAMGHPDALAALPFVHRPVGALRSPAMHLSFQQPVAATGEATAPLSLQRPAEIRLRAEPNRGQPTSALCLASIRHGAWRCLDRRLYGASAALVHASLSEYGGELGGELVVLDQIADPPPIPTAAPSPLLPSHTPSSSSSTAASSVDTAGLEWMPMSTSLPILGLLPVLFLVCLCRTMPQLFGWNQKSDAVRRPSFSDWATPDDHGADQGADPSE